LLPSHLLPSLLSHDHVIMFTNYYS
uniref:Uncharacterized protein n=1 Tax=Amphimedon queenslandica TaxID=400682 RepID=A0A1X7VC84_AMPQE